MLGVEEKKRTTHLYLPCAYCVCHLLRVCRLLSIQEECILICVTLCPAHLSLTPRDRQTPVRRGEDLKKKRERRWPCLQSSPESKGEMGKNKTAIMLILRPRVMAAFMCGLSLRVSPPALPMKRSRQGDILCSPVYVLLLPKHHLLAPRPTLNRTKLVSIRPGKMSLHVVLYWGRWGNKWKKKKWGKKREMESGVNLT